MSKKTIYYALGSVLLLAGGYVTHTYFSAEKEKKIENERKTKLMLAKTQMHTKRISK